VKLRPSQRAHQTGFMRPGQIIGRYSTAYGLADPGLRQARGHIAGEKVAPQVDAFKK